MRNFKARLEILERAVTRDGHRYMTIFPKNGPAFFATAGEAINRLREGTLARVETTDPEMQNLADMINQLT